MTETSPHLVCFVNTGKLHFKNYLYGKYASILQKYTKVIKRNGTYIYPKWFKFI